jgi:DNA-binding response OmpR family regulator/DNA-binding CsgD family transcriptional regulator
MTAPQPSAAARQDLVLIVDDDPDSRALLHRTLLSAGLTPLLAADGGQALALLEDVSPDLILLDAVMPPPDGFETCRRIKTQPALAHIPVIFMTGLSDTQHVVAGLGAGGVDYVTKPIILDELIARIHVHLNNARIAQSARTALDAAGRIRWTTPQAALVLGGPEREAELAPVIAKLIRDIGPHMTARPSVRIETGGLPIEISYIGGAGSADYFFRISSAAPGSEVAILQNALGLTPRESDVLLWIANGKSNRDTSEILNISARTVNKHLEQIFIKLGVENRAAAASIATRIIAMQG